MSAKRELAPVAALLELQAVPAVAVVYHPAFWALVKVKLARQHANRCRYLVFVVGGKMLLTRL
jgi:hypothetical protein